LAHHQKKLKLGRLPKITVSIEDQVLSLWLIYFPEKGRCEGKNFGQSICNKVRCCWEHPWEAHWELGEQSGNMMRTLENKNPLPHPPQRKKDETLLAVCLVVSLAACIFYS